MVSYEFCEISNNAFFTEELRATAFAWKSENLVLSRKFKVFAIVKTISFENFWGKSYA